MEVCARVTHATGIPEATGHRNRHLSRPKQRQGQRPRRSSKQTSGRSSWWTKLVGAVAAERRSSSLHRRRDGGRWKTLYRRRTCLFSGGAIGSHSICITCAETRGRVMWVVCVLTAPALGVFEAVGERDRVPEPGRALAGSYLPYKELRAGILGILRCG